MRIHQFWYGNELPPFAIECMKRIKKFGYEPTLWVYEQGKPSNIPSFVTIKNADDIISFEYFQSRFKNSKLVHFTKNNEKKKYFAAVALSDIFRVKLLHKVGGWWFDTDVILLKKLPNVKEVVSTLPRKLDGVFTRKKPNFNYVPTGDINCSVMKVAKGSKWAYKYLIRAFALVESHYEKGTSMKSIVDIMRLLLDVLPKGVAAHPTLYNPLPVWTSKIGATSFGYKIPTLDEIAQKSYTLSLSGPLLKRRYNEIIQFIESYEK